MKRSPRIRFRIDFGDDLHLGPGKIELLEAIAEHGSLNVAARAAGLSYRRAWLLLDSINRSFDRPVVESIIGGKRGGGSSVTPFGHLLIKSYRQMERQILGVGADCLSTILPHVARHAPVDGIARQRLARKVVSSSKPAKPRGD